MNGIEVSSWVIFAAVSASATATASAIVFAFTAHNKRRTEGLVASAAELKLKFEFEIEFKFISVRNFRGWVIVGVDVLDPAGVRTGVLINGGGAWK